MLKIMEQIIGELVQSVEFEKKERFSKLSYSGIKKISRLDRKVAIITGSSQGLGAAIAKKLSESLNGYLNTYKN